MSVEQKQSNRVKIAILVSGLILGVIMGLFTIFSPG
jgi:hypothetical protein